MISAVQTSKRKGKHQQVISTGNLYEKRNLTQSAFAVNRKAYQNPVRKESAIVQTSRAAVISGATPFSIPIRYSSYNLNANNEALKFTPRSGSMPRIVGEEPGDYGDREAIRFHKKKEESEEGKGEGEAETVQEEPMIEKKIKKENVFDNPSEGTIKGMTEGAENAARLADLAYDGPDEADLSYFLEKGYVLDDDFSTEEHIVIVDPNRRQVAVGIRGTAFNLNNMLADATIALGGFPQSERARRTLQLRDQLRQRYPDFKLHFAGHSLGGTAAAYAAEGDENAVATTFNAGSTPFGGATVTGENVTNYRTEGDAISQGISNAITIPKQCSSSLAHSSSQFVPGAPCQKRNFFTFMKNSIESTANTAAKAVKMFSPLVPPEVGVPLKLASRGTTYLLGEAERQNRGEPMEIEAPPQRPQLTAPPERRQLTAPPQRRRSTGQPMEGIDYAQPMEIEAPPQRPQLTAPPERRQLTAPPQRRRSTGQPMEGIDYAQPMEIEAPPQRPQLTAPSQRLQLTGTGIATGELELAYTDFENEKYREFLQYMKKYLPNERIIPKKDFVEHLRGIKKGTSRDMDWEQTYQDLSTTTSGVPVRPSLKTLPPSTPLRPSLKKLPPSTAVQRSARMGKAVVPLLEYSAGGMPASTSGSTRRRYLTADREIVNQNDKVIEGRTRNQNRQNPELQKQLVDYWKGRSQPKKPRRKRGESQQAFDKRKSDYVQYLDNWKTANIRKTPSRKAKSKKKK
jgi:hypothetical protein